MPSWVVSLFLAAVILTICSRVRHFLPHFLPQPLVAIVSWSVKPVPEVKYTLETHKACCGQLDARHALASLHRTACQRIFTSLLTIVSQQVSNPLHSLYLLSFCTSSGLSCKANLANGLQRSISDPYLQIWSQTISDFRSLASFPLQSIIFHLLSVQFMGKGAD